MVKSILLSTLPLFSTQSFAQGAILNNNLHQSDSVHIMQRVHEYVGQFTEYMYAIADKSTSQKVRNYYKDVALSLFIGGGNEYYEEILDDNNNVIDTLHHDAVKITFNSIRNNRITKRPLKSYLRSLAEIHSKPVTISSIKCHEMRVSSFQKIAEGKYVCTVYFEQIFINKNREIKSVTKCGIKKRLSCSVELIKTEDGMEEVLVLLGDIEGDLRNSL